MKLMPSLLLLAAAAVPATAAADVMLNEVMQSNVYTIMDDLNEFPDAWVELYNSGADDIDIQGYRLGQKDDFEACDALRHAVIRAGGYLLVYCDKADVDMHTSFRLDSGKGTVYLFDPSGNKVDEVSLKKMPAPDVAYGRDKDGGSKWGYMLTPTPGKANEGGQGKTVLGPVVFSADGGVWKDNQPFSLELYLPDDAPEGSKIIYTVNGREPVPGNCQYYSDDTPIWVSTSRVVRAKVICDGCISIPSNAQSYIFLGREMKIPVISIAVNHEYLYDQYIGIFADGVQGGWHNENYFYDWRRPINMEFFAEEGMESELNQLCEMRVQGGYTRENALKSLALYANKRFGTKRFAYEFWPADKPGVTDNKSLVLRNGGNDFAGAYFRDPLCQRVLARNSKNVDWQGYSPAIVYINGSYHGMLAIRERSNEDNIAANYDGLEDIDMFENWDELKAGDRVAREEFNSLVYGARTFDEWNAAIDIDSYFDMMALNYWIYNGDFPHNNIVMWRSRISDDGRWRWLIKDCDFGLGTWNSNENLYKNYGDYLDKGTDGIGYDMWRGIMATPGMKEYFRDRLIAMMGDYLNADTFSAYLDEIIAENHGEQQISHQKWGSWWANLDNNWQFIRDWCKKRQSHMPTLMKATFGVGDAVDLTVNAALDADEASALGLTFCGTPLTRGTFSGKEYVGHTMTLQGAAGAGIVGWTVQVGNNPAQTYDTPVLEYTFASKGTYKVNAVVDHTGIADVIAEAAGLRIDGLTVYADGTVTIYDTAGRKVATGQGHATVASPGVYMVRTATATAKVVL